MAETLRDYLRRQNPTLGQMEHRSNKKNTRNSQYKIPREIAEWKGFDAVTLQSMYSDLLDHVDKRDALKFRPNDLEVKSETGGFSDVVFFWNREVVFRSLEETRDNLSHDHLVYMVRGEKAGYLPGLTKGLRPDWAAIHLGKDGKAASSSPNNFLPGDTKYSDKWKSASIQVGEIEGMFERKKEFPEWFMPLAQIFTYCWASKTRYAYIITDEELVLFRVGPQENVPRPSPVSREQEVQALESQGKIEFVSVPWVNGRSEDGIELGDPNGLTINTALWWIHLQAACSHSIKWSYPCLEKETLQRQDSLSPEDRLTLPQDESCFTGDNYASTEREASDTSDIVPSFIASQEASQFASPQSSSLNSRRILRKRNSSRTQAEYSFSSTVPDVSFISHSSTASRKSKVEKPKGKIAKRGRPARSEPGDKRAKSKKN